MPAAVLRTAGVHFWVSVSDQVHPVGRLDSARSAGDDRGMTRRIQPRRWRVGSDGGLEPEDIEALDHRREKHERLTQRPSRAFGEVLRERLKADRPDPEPQEEEGSDQGARDPLLGLDPNQNAGIANSGAGRRSGRVIVKG